MKTHLCVVNGGTKGDEADVIIRNILSNYEKAAHPNSERDDGAVVIQIGITPLSISIVSLVFLKISSARFSHAPKIVSGQSRKHFNF